LPKKKIAERGPVFTVKGCRHIRVLGIVLAGGKGTWLFPKELGSNLGPIGTKYRVKSHHRVQSRARRINKIWIERWSPEPKVGGSNPLRRASFFSSVDKSAPGPGDQLLRVTVWNRAVAIWADSGADVTR